jgi:ATP-dependent Clp protease ATP-binding subunit ClpX
MSVAVYNHYKRLMQQQQDDEVEIEKKHHYGGTNRNRKNIGCKTIAKMLDVPLAIVDATV